MSQCETHRLKPRLIFYKANKIKRFKIFKIFSKEIKLKKTEMAVTKKKKDRKNVGLLPVRKPNQ